MMTDEIDDVIREAFKHRTLSPEELAAVRELATVVQNAATATAKHNALRDIAVVCKFLRDTPMVSLLRQIVKVRWLWKDTDKAKIDEILRGS